MNDQSAGWSPDSGDDAFDRHRLRSLLERALMDRARRAAERDRQKSPRRPLQQVLALAAALSLVLLIGLGFDAFLTSVQKVLRLIEADDAQRRDQTVPAPTDPMPAYVVPAEPPPATDTPR